MNGSKYASMQLLSPLEMKIWLPNVQWRQRNSSITHSLPFNPYGNASPSAYLRKKNFLSNKIQP